MYESSHKNAPANKKKRGKLMFEHAHKGTNQHLEKKEEKSSLSMLIKGTSI